jgi:hypothetical protein
MESRSSTAQSKTARSLLFVERHVAERVLETLDTPVSLGVFLRLKYTEEDPSLWVDIAKASVNAEDYLEWYPSRFADDYLAVSLLRKSPSLPTGIDREEVALNNFFEAEEQCRLATFNCTKLRGLMNIQCSFTKSGTRFANSWEIVIKASLLTLLPGAILGQVVQWGRIPL